jgi:N-acetylglutamate synthase-like GNAT family acetyltransferase
MNVKIRNARVNDLDAMTALLGELFSIEADFAVDERRQRRGLDMMVNNCRKTSCVKVAEADGKVVGMCTIQILISTAEGGMVGLVEDMVVASNLRGQGVGRQLMENIEDWAKRQKVIRLQLLADRTNFSALDFYSEMSWYPTRLICVRRAWEN